MTTLFKITAFCGGIARGPVRYIQADTITEIADELGARIVNSAPNWAFLQGTGGLTSYTVSW